MKTAEDLAKETLQKKMKFSPNTWTDCHTCFVYGYDAAKPEWISVKERLPEVDERVVIYDRGQFDTSYLTVWGHWAIKEQDSMPQPTHWMPLPLPPEE